MSAEQAAKVKEVPSAYQRPGQLDAQLVKTRSQALTSESSLENERCKGWGIGIYTSTECY